MFLKLVRKSSMVYREIWVVECVMNLLNYSSYFFLSSVYRCILCKCNCCWRDNTILVLDEKAKFKKTNSMQ